MTRALWPALLAGAALALLPACTQRDVDRAGTAIESAAPAFANDGILVARVEARLLRIDAGSALHVAVASQGGVVRLSGKVKSAAIGARYVAATRALPGVKRVDATLAADPHLAQTPGDVSDFALATAVRAALIGQAGVNALGLDVKAHGGAILVAGKVRTAALKATLLDAARHTRGVKSVVDRLQVGA